MVFFVCVTQTLWVMILQHIDINFFNKLMIVTLFFYLIYYFVILKIATKLTAINFLEKKVGSLNFKNGK